MKKEIKIIESRITKLQKKLDKLCEDQGETQCYIKYEYGLDLKELGRYEFFYLKQHDTDVNVVCANDWKSFKWQALDHFGIELEESKY
tara:strand:+ start:120 stop:383 length:264 start_codon:yes stop_codon:yes gene_type:complete